MHDYVTHISAKRSKVSITFKTSIIRKNSQKNRAQVLTHTLMHRRLKKKKRFKTHYIAALPIDIYIYFFRWFIFHRNADECISPNTAVISLVRILFYYIRAKHFKANWFSRMKKKIYNNFKFPLNLFPFLSDIVVVV